MTTRLAARRMVVALGLSFSVCTAAAARAATLTAVTILERARAAVEAGGSRSAEFTLEVQAPTWTAERAGRFYKDLRPDGHDTLIVLDDPAPVRGVKVLSRQPARGPMNVWLYVPATHRARRIATGENGRNLFGGDFSASDLEQRRLGLDAVLERREMRNSRDAYVVRLTGAEDGASVDETLWIDAGNYRLVRREFRSDNALRRVYSADAIELVDGIPTAVDMTVINVADATRTRIRLRNVRYAVALDPMLFAHQHLDDRIAATVSDGSGESPLD